MRVPFSILLSTLVLLPGTTSAQEIYRWADENGHKQFSSQPPPLSCQTNSCLAIHNSVSSNVGESVTEEYQAKIPPCGADNDYGGDCLVMPADTAFCASLRTAERYDKAGRHNRKKLEDESQCIVSAADFEYSVEGSPVGRYTPATIFIGAGTLEAWWIIALTPKLRTPDRSNVDFSYDQIIADLKVGVALGQRCANELEVFQELSNQTCHRFVKWNNTTDIQGRIQLMKGQNREVSQIKQSNRLLGDLSSAMQEITAWVEVLKEP